VVVPDNNAIGKIADHLQATGLNIRAIRNPTIPKGAKRLRIV
jgi:7-keto-8-aminopelargonate synthetase-like enzyme